jgi:O-antigen/teichoic acid export membrane protein
MTRFGIYITLLGAVITILINVLLIPVYGYMASAWAHVASYGAMIVLSFVFAEKRFKVDYNMRGLIPYFVLAIGMVIFSLNFTYRNLLTELFINTVLLVIFIGYAEYKDKVIETFFGKTSI